MTTNSSWKQEAERLRKEGKEVGRSMARELGVSWSTLWSAFYRNADKTLKSSEVNTHIHKGAKILFLDVEVSPSVTLAFSRFKAFATPDHVLKEPYMLTYVVKWAHQAHTIGNSIVDTNSTSTDDDYQLICDLWDYIDEADIVVAQNEKFDRGWFNQRCIVHGLNPPSPYKVIDTLQMMKKNLSLPSNSLGAAAKYFNLTRKLGHEGITLWQRCMAGEKEAFEEMLEYNRGDVVTLEELYNVLQPWCKEMPNLALYHEDNTLRCIGCGSDNVVELQDKYAYTALSKFAVVKCCDCGKHMRTRFNVRTKEQMQNTATIASLK